MKWLCFVFLFLASALDAAKKNPQPVVAKPFAPLEAARTMQVPKGFKIMLFAGEPDVKQLFEFWR